MTGKRNRDPPILNDDDDYEEWAREIEIWQIMTDLDVTKQGASIYFSLRGKARKCCKTINVEELQGEDGVKKLLEKLAELYAPDKDKSTFKKYELFEEFQQPERVL